MKWSSMFHQESTRKDLSKDSIDSLSIVQDSLDQISEDLQKQVVSLLSIANQLRLVEDLLLGKDSVT